MIVAVVQETFPGERRGVIPASIPPLVKAGPGGAGPSGAGVSAGFPDRLYADKGRQDRRHPRRGLRRRRGAPGPRRRGQPRGWPADLPRYRAGQVVIGMADPLGRPRPPPKLAGRGVDAVCPGIDAPHHPGPEHGRAQLAGHGGRLSGGAAGRHGAAENVSHDDDRRRHARRRPKSSSSAREWPACKPSPAPRGWAASSRPTTCVRPSRSRCKAWGPSSSKCRWNRRRRNQGRLRQGDGRGVLSPAAGDDEPRGRRKRRGDHHRGRARPEGAHADHGRDGRRHGPGLGDRRCGGRAGRQLRVDPARRNRGPRRRDDSRPDRICPPKCPIMPARCSPRTSPRSCWRLSARAS